MKNFIKIVIYSLIVTILLLTYDYLARYQISLINIFMFFILIIFIISFFKRAYLFFILFDILALIAHLFFNYYQRSIVSFDIYNFFTHISETFETLFGMLGLFIPSLAIFLIIISIILVLNILKIKKYDLPIWIKYPILSILLFMNLNSTSGFKLIASLIDTPWAFNKKITYEEKPLYPIRENNMNIIFIIGESMKYDDYVEQKLKNQGFFYKKIYSAATNTDLSLPLLLNAKDNPLKLKPDNQTNLFRLAKKSGFKTAFISIQSEKSLRYIKPYLQLEQIDYYKSFSKKERRAKFDFFLFDKLKELDLSVKNFVVLEQIGQHSPYRYFKGSKSNDPSKNYILSIDHSFELYKQIYDYLKSSKKPFILIYTSDHGEFSGENGRYGHNCFDPIIYNVPFFITSNRPFTNNHNQIKSHYDLSKFLIYLFGYGKKFEIKEHKIIINGTMLSREDGFIEIE